MVKAQRELRADCSPMATRLLLPAGGLEKNDGENCRSREKQEWAAGTASSAPTAQAGRRAGVSPAPAHQHRARATVGQDRDGDGQGMGSGEEGQRDRTGMDWEGQGMGFGEEGQLKAMVSTAIPKCWHRERVVPELGGFSVPKWKVLHFIKTTFPVI